MKFYWQDKRSFLVLRLVVLALSVLTIWSFLADRYLHREWDFILLPLIALAVAGGLLILPGRRLSVLRLIAAFVLVVMPHVLYDNATLKRYVDVVAGRDLLVWRVCGMPIKKKLDEGNLVIAYREAMGQEAPEPAWWPDWETSYGWSYVHSDWFTHDMRDGAQELGRCIQKSRVSLEFKRKALKAFVDLLPSEGTDRRSFADLKYLFSTLMGGNIAHYDYMLITFGHLEEVPLPEIPDMRNFAPKFFNHAVPAEENLSANTE